MVFVVHAPTSSASSTSLGLWSIAEAGAERPLSVPRSLIRLSRRENGHPFSSGVRCATSLSRAFHGQS